MAECPICGDTDHLSRECNYCGGTFCSKHTLPEKHNCPATRVTNNAGKHFESAFEGTPETDSSKKSRSSSKRENRVADDRRDVTKDKKSKIDIEEFKKRQQAADHASGTNREEDTESADSTYSASKSNQYGQQESDSKPYRGRRRSQGDSSPDVAPDGSVVKKDNRLDRELDRMREQANREKNRIRHVRWTLKSLFLRLFLAATSLRVWVVVLVAIASMGQLGYAPVPGLPTDRDTVESTVENAAGYVANATQSGELNRSTIEKEVHQEINERREARGLRPLEYDEQLQIIARSHSRDMAERKYFSHDSPEGKDFEYRYNEHGYSCRVPTGSGTYAEGAENIAYTYANERIQLDSGGTAYYSNETEIAEGLVNQWMNSTGHRENILRPYWQNQGIGIYIIEVDGKTRVYATQNFC